MSNELFAIIAAIRNDLAEALGQSDHIVIAVAAAKARDGMNAILAADPQPTTCPKCRTTLDLQPYVETVATPQDTQGRDS